MGWARQDHPWRWTTCDANWMLQMRKFLLWCQCVQLDTAKWQLSVLHSIRQDQTEKAGSLTSRLVRFCNLTQPDPELWTEDGPFQRCHVQLRLPTFQPSNLPTFAPVQQCFALGPGGTFCADLERTPTKHRTLRAETSCETLRNTYMIVPCMYIYLT